MRGWLYKNRTSARLTLMVRLAATAISSVLALVWTPLLVTRMGDRLYGVFMSFFVIPRLGGLSDMGVNGAISLRTAQMLGRGEPDRLRLFLASARTFVLLLSLSLAGVFFLLSPWLPGWFHFEEAPRGGSLVLLFQTGALALFLLVAGGYIQSVNFGFGNNLWPILPSLLIAQAGLLGHCWLAGAGAPLWMQHLPYLASGLATMVLVWWLLKKAHPWLADLRPLRVDFSVWRELLSTSGWVYLYTLGGFIFTMTDRLLINAGIGAAAVPGYMFNYKPCELALQVVAAACVATLSKINQWVANPAEESQQRAREGLQRLGLFQNCFGIVFALGYLALNNQFIKMWVGNSYQSSAALQLAFALVLAITAGGDAAIQTSAICGSKGLRSAGMAIGAASLINLGLSFVAMRAGSLEGIAFATVLAQSLLSIMLTRYTCRHLKMSFRAWVIRSWMVPVGAVLVGFGIRWFVGVETPLRTGMLCGIFAVLIVLVARFLGFTRKFLDHEISILRNHFHR